MSLHNYRLSSWLGFKVRTLFQRPGWQGWQAVQAIWTVRLLTIVKLGSAHLQYSHSDIAG